MKKIFRLLLLVLFAIVFIGMQPTSAEKSVNVDYPEAHINSVSLNPGDTAQFRYKIFTNWDKKWRGAIKITPASEQKESFRVQVDHYLPARVGNGTDYFDEYIENEESYFSSWSEGSLANANAEGWWQIKLTNNSEKKVTYNVQIKHDFNEIAEW